MNARKFPRTMQEAFGPYTSRQICSEPDPMHPVDKLVLKVCVVAVVALIVLALFGGLPS